MIQPGDRVRVTNPGPEHGNVGRMTLEVVSVDGRGIAVCVLAGTKMGPFCFYEHELEREVQEVS